MAMTDQETTSFVRDLMKDFAERTGPVGERAPTRYLWTDAFAVCNFSGLEQRTGDKTYRALALRLVDSQGQQGYYQVGERIVACRHDYLRSFYHGYRNPREIISHAVWAYHRFDLSFRNVEEVPVNRGGILPV